MRDTDEADNIRPFPRQDRPPGTKAIRGGIFHYDDDKVTAYFHLTEEDLDLEQSWLIEGMLLDSMTAELTGPSKSGKTMALMAMHHAVAHGRPFLGQEAEKDCSIFIATERPLFARHGLYGYDVHYGTDSDDLIVIVEWKGLDLVAMEVEDLANVLEPIITRLEKRSQLKLRLISFDTLAKATPRSDENTGDYSAVDVTLSQLADHFKACLLITRHFGKDPRRSSRGASNLQYGAASVITISKARESAEGSITMEECSKSMLEGKEFGFKTQIVEVGKDRKRRPVTTRVMLYSNVVKITQQKLKRSTHDAELVRLLRPVFAAGRSLPVWARAKADYHTDRYATKADLLAAISAAYPNAADAAKRKMLRQAFDRMVEKGEWFGSEKRPRSDEVAVWPRNGWLPEEGENDQDS